MNTFTNNLKFRAINRISEGYKYSDDFDELSQFFQWVEEKLCEVERWTGLLDKNGKEIYENDIVKTNHDGNHKASFEYLTWLLRNCEKMEMEIIGNIHQNPELLQNNNLD